MDADIQRIYQVFGKLFRPAPQRHSGSGNRRWSLKQLEGAEKIVAINLLLALRSAHSFSLCDNHSEKGATENYLTHHNLYLLLIQLAEVP